VPFPGGVGPYPPPPPPPPPSVFEYTQINSAATNGPVTGMFTYPFTLAQDAFVLASVDCKPYAPAFCMVQWDFGPNLYPNISPQRGMSPPYTGTLMFWTYLSAGPHNISLGPIGPSSWEYAWQLGKIVMPGSTVQGSSSGNAQNSNPLINGMPSITVAHRASVACLGRMGYTPGLLAANGWVQAFPQVGGSSPVSMIVYKKSPPDSGVDNCNPDNDPLTTAWCMCQVTIGKP